VGRQLTKRRSAGIFIEHLLFQIVIYQPVAPSLAAGFYASSATLLLRWICLPFSTSDESDEGLFAVVNAPRDLRDRQAVNLVFVVSESPRCALQRRCGGVTRNVIFKYIKHFPLLLTDDTIVSVSSVSVAYKSTVISMLQYGKLGKNNDLVLTCDNDYYCHMSIIVIFMTLRRKV
jgi:hypothetical protein